MKAATESGIITQKVKFKPENKEQFLNWQADLNAKVAAFPGFVSLETNIANNEWLIVERFDDQASCEKWKQSSAYKELLKELNTFAEEDNQDNPCNFGVTEVFVTKVSPQKENEYRQWTSKIHQVESKFPGFKGTLIQSPKNVEEGNWITLLQFDSPENLDNWLNSKERREIVKELDPMIASMENHRMVSSYSGWFHSVEKQGVAPATWKQTMLVLLVLYPIVMLEVRYLLPHLTMFNHAFATFIGNSISVTLVAWPLMPIAIWALSWWLIAKNSQTWITLAGIAVIGFLYLLEIYLLWA
jgi:antibiotic biosynthesis monooxygenase (ABM) superfamily enzyme